LATMRKGQYSEVQAAMRDVAMEHHQVLLQRLSALRACCVGAGLGVTDTRLKDVIGVQKVLLGMAIMSQGPT
jgi:hypothetical protein